MKKIIYGLLAIVVIMVIAMFAIGKDYQFEKSMTINAPSEEVWQHVNSMKNINQWNPWVEMDPKIVSNYSGPEGKVGDHYAWSGNDEVGEGNQTISQIDPMKKVTTDIHFIKPFESDMTSSIVLKPEGGKTIVTWTANTTMDYPSNFMKVIMDPMMDESYTKGLTKLKELCEK